jgi:UDP-N-acetylmuramoylalanine--D-glutamate ligase
MTATGMTGTGVLGPGTIRGRHVLVLGMARSGFGAVRLCLKEGAVPTGLDLREPAGFAAEIAKLTEAGARFHWGPHPSEALDHVDLIVKSPGVPGEIPFLGQARAREIKIVSEIEFASWFARGPILAITGTNGKSTTTAWVADMFVRCGRAHELVGNIGRAISEGVVHSSAGSVLVTEVSSFQLEDVETFHPIGATILNLTPDHLDRHPDLVSYREAKMQVFRNQTPADHAVIGEDDDIAAEVGRRFRARLLRFRLEDRGEEGTFVRDGQIGIRLGGTERMLCAVADLSLPGRHNIANALAGLALAAPLGLPEDGLLASLRSFPGLSHRLETVGEVDGVRYVNDSKATNTDSTAIALEAFEAPLILLAGGRDKGQDFRPLAGQVRRRCRRVFLFGESAASIQGQWGPDLCAVVPDMATALDQAAAIATPGEIVLLSPACASFDQFKNYEDRGDRFRDLVRGRASGGNRQ